MEYAIEILGSQLDSITEGIEFEEGEELQQSVKRSRELNQALARLEMDDRFAAFNSFTA